MAIVKVEEHICDFCGKPVSLDEVHVGTLAVRKRGARGRKVEIPLSMHARCIPVPKMTNGPAPKRVRVKAKATV